MPLVGPPELRLVSSRRAVLSAARPCGSSFLDQLKFVCDCGQTTEKVVAH